MSAFEVNDHQDDDGLDEELIRPAPGTWALLGACRGKPVDWWFPARGESVAEARSICEACPVQAQCLTHAVSVRERFGMWGGRSERERRHIRHQTHRRSA